MDFTLAQYKEEFDLLAYNGAQHLLVDTMGYPTALFSYKYKQNLFRRGCLIDKKRGNIIKLGREINQSLEFPIILHYFFLIFNALHIYIDINYAAIIYIYIDILYIKIVLSMFE